MADRYDDEDEDLVLYHPNREKAASKATKAIVALLLLVAAFLVLVITAGGWKNLQGAQVVSVLYILVFCVMAYYVMQWVRGVLPLAAGLGIGLLVVAALAAPTWFDRDHSGYDTTGLPPALIGLLDVILIPVCLLLIAFAMRAFAQQWNIEIEMTREELEERRRQDQGRGRGGYRAQPQG
jgi:presenilin-like A22 family membrane protease